MIFISVNVTSSHFYNLFLSLTLFSSVCARLHFSFLWRFLWRDTSVPLHWHWHNMCVCARSPAPALFHTIEDIPHVMPFVLTLFSIQIFRSLFSSSSSSFRWLFISILFYLEHFFSNLFPLFILIMHEASFIMRCEHILIARSYIFVIAVIMLLCFVFIYTQIHTPCSIWTKWIAGYTMERFSSICVCMWMCWLIVSYFLSVHV